MFGFFAAVVLAAVVAAGFLEFVVPPFFGDTVLLLGFFSAERGVLRGELVFAAALVGSIAGAAGSYALGRRFRTPPLGAERFLTPPRLARISGWFERHGAKALVLNRFFPGIRALFLFMAGAGKMPFGRVLLWSTVGSALWCAFLMYLAGAAGSTWETAVAGSKAAIRSVGLVVLVGSLGVSGVVWLRSRRHTRNG